MKRIVKYFQAMFLWGGLMIAPMSTLAQYDPTEDCLVVYHNVSDCTMGAFGYNGEDIAAFDTQAGGAGYISPWTVTFADPGYVYYTGSSVEWNAFLEDGGSGWAYPSQTWCDPGVQYDIYIWASDCGYGPLDDNSDGGGDGGPGCGCCNGGGGAGGGGAGGSGGGSGGPNGFGGPPPSGPPPPPAFGMPVWKVSEPYLSLWLMDEPLGYQPSVGSRIELKLAYKQRESTVGTMTRVFSLGQKWNFSWISYASPGPFGTNAIVHFPSGMTRTFTTTNDYLTNTRLTGDMTNGYTVYYPDGSMDYYACIVGKLNPFPYGAAFLSKHVNPQSQATLFNYTTNQWNGPDTSSIVRLISVVDGSGKTNLIYYNTGNSFSSNLISQVTDPYGRSAYFAYDTNGCLTNIVDIDGITNSCFYNTNIWITNLTTPYGQTTFVLADGPGTNAPPVGRSVLVTDPDGSSELYLSEDSAPGIASSYGSGEIPNTGSVANMFDTANLNVRNTFYWGKRQYANLSTTNIASLAANDFRLAEMKHWLLTSDLRFSETVSVERDPSPDAGGTIAGEMTWYDYGGKTNSQYVGTQYLPQIAARVLPDGTTSFNYQARNSYGLVTTNISTFGIGSAAALRTSIFTYNLTNQIDLITVTNALDVQTSSNLFNAYHEVQTNYDALNEMTIYTYDASQRVTSITLPTGLYITNSYGSDGFLAQQVKTGIATNSYTYSNALLQTYTTPLGMTAVNTWDNLQRLTGTTFPDGTFTSNQYTYLDLTATKDRLGNWSYYGYDSLRRLIAATNALNNYTLYGYCTCGVLETIRDALGHYTTNNYDNQSRLTNVWYPDGYSVTFNINLIAQITNSMDSGGMSVTNWYDNQGLVFASSNAFGQVFFKSFDILGRVTNSVDANGVVLESVYDNLNRLISRSYPAPTGGTETFGYSAAGLVAYTNQLGYSNFYGYDAASRKIAETNALGFTTQYTYDGASDLTSLTDQNTNTTKWGYDLYGRVTNKVDATTTTILTYQYDGDNRLTNRWSAAKSNTAYAYDAVGNLTNVTYPVSSRLSFAYNAMNWMTTMNDGIGTTTFTYTPAGQLASETGPWASDAVIYTYANRLRAALTIQQPNGAGWAQTYGYDSAERLKTITGQPGTFTYTYNAGLGGVTASSSLVGNIALPNGAYISDVYDNNGRMTTNSLYNSGGTPLDYYAYTYNKGNQRTQVTRNTENYADYSYDPIGEVVSDQAFESGGTTRLNEQLGYVFDPAGNLNYRTNNALIANFKVNSLNELTVNTNGGRLTVMGAATTQNSDIVTVNGTNAAVYGDATFVATNMPFTTSYTAIASDSYGRHSTNTVTVSLSTNVGFQYDGNANLTNDGLRNFAYDDENQLIQVLVSNQWMSEFSYDGKMRRRIRKEFSWQSGGWVETNEVHYVYDGNLVIQERDMNNLPQVTYTRGKDLSGSLEGAGGIGGLLARSSQTYSDASLAGQSFYHSDANGNITMLIDSSQGIVAKYLYDAFGNTISKSGLLADANVYRFSSKEWHANSGLAYYLYRYYDPNLQRWLNRDPIMENGGIDLYGFVANDPINSGDYFGLAGGPYHPPDGVSLSCDPGDSCAMLTAKMQLIMKVISSHVGWDRNMPWPRGGGRHAEEIAGFWVAYARCQAIHAAKNCRDFEPPSIWTRIICKVPGSNQTWNNVAIGSAAVAIAASGGALGIAAGGAAAPILILAPAGL